MLVLKKRSTSRLFIQKFINHWCKPTLIFIFWFFCNIKGYPRFKIMFCSNVALDVKLMKIFIWRKNNASFSRYLDFCVSDQFQNQRFQNLWRHHRSCSIMEVTLMLSSFESWVLSKWNLVKYYCAVWKTWLICFWFNARVWKLVPFPFMISLKWQCSKIWPFLMLAFTTFNFTLFTFSMKRWNLDIIGYWVIGAGSKIKKGLELSLGPLNCSKDFWKLLLLHISINWPSLVTLSVVVQNTYLRMHPVSCTNAHHDVTDLVNHRIAKNKKIWISWERNITFLTN